MNISSALSGLQAATFRQNTSAHDIANSNTDGYSQKQVSQSEANPGTQISSVKAVPNTAKFSNTDYAEEIVESKIQTHSYSANLKSIQTQDRMLGDLLDIIK